MIDISFCEIRGTTTLIDDTVDLMHLSENVELNNNNLCTPKPENID